jgi:hypothetical protein
LHIFSIAMRSIILFVGLAAAMAEETSFESGIALIKDQLEQTMLNGQSHGAGLASGQKNMVLSMLSEIDGQTPLSDESQTAIQQAINLLIEIKDSLGSDRDADTTAINTIVNSVNTCYPQSAVDDENTKKATADASKADHHTCRTQQNVTEAAKIEACDTDFHDYMKGAMVTTLNCGEFIYEQQNQNQLETIGKLETTSEHVTWTESVLSQRMGRYNELRDLCSTAWNENTAKQGECDTDMDQFVNDYCAYAGSREARCGAEGGCYNGLKQDYDSAVESRTTTGNQRWKDAMQLDVIICYLNKIKNGDNDLSSTDYSACVNPPVRTPTEYQSDYQASYDAFPDQQACVVFDAADLPRGDNWHASEMDPWHCTDDGTHTFHSWCILKTQYTSC